jgi:methylmalonyl-CoA mutase, N-terminal domain
MTKEAVQLPLPGFDRDFAQWRADYARQIGEDRRIANRSGIEIKPLYTPRDWDGATYETDLGFPANIRTPAACTRPCTAAAHGHNAS